MSLVWCLALDVLGANLNFSANLSQIVILIVHNLSRTLLVYSGTMTVWQLF